MNSNNLEQWILQLIREGSIHSFYKSTAWFKLSQEVLREQHYECQICKQRGVYTKATTVHHINYVRRVPRLALSKTYEDDHGRTRKNLIAVCSTCHNHIHKRIIKKQLNQERW